jgi:hypothetical protein
VTLKRIPLLACALAVLATGAHAQFTAAVVAPKAKTKVDTTARQDSVRHAAVALAARVTDMKKWVDSAAGVPLPPETDSSKAVASASDSTPATKDSVILNRNARIRADSAASIATVEVHDSTGLKADTAATAAPPTSERQRTARDRTARDTTRATAGTLAPNTATELPLLALIAASTLLAGLALRRS